MAQLSTTLSALLGELENSPNNVIKFLTAVLSEVNDLEAVLYALLTQRSLDTAIGAQLDVLGSIVDEPRNGLSDDDYRRFIGAKILVNKSSGTIPELIDIAVAVVNDSFTYRFANELTATVYLRLYDKALSANTAAILFELERLATSAGVRLMIEYSPIAPVDWLILDSSVSTQVLDAGVLTDQIAD